MPAWLTALFQLSQFPPSVCKYIYIDHEVEQNPYEVTRLSAQPGKYFPSAEPTLHMGRMSSKHQAQPLLHTATTKPILYSHVAIIEGGNA